MNDDLRRKLLNDIDKSGFGSEMRAVRAFQECGWSVTGAAAYYDRDANITREIDIKAYRGLRSEDPVAVELLYSIVGEVKKASNPWIVIRGGSEYKWELIDAWDNITFVDGLEGKKSSIARELGRFSLSQSIGWIARGLHESFKPPDAANRWYSAFVAACKGAEDNFTSNTPVHDEGVVYFYFCKPLVILDGQLFSARLVSDEIVLEEIDYATHRFSFQTSEYNRRSYLVDLVKLSALPDYLSLCGRRAQHILDTLVRSASSPARQASKPVKKFKVAK